VKAASYATSAEPACGLPPLLPQNQNDSDSEKRNTAQLPAAELFAAALMKPARSKARQGGARMVIV
jgi:hypothetical protein